MAAIGEFALPGGGVHRVELEERWIARPSISVTWNAQAAAVPLSIEDQKASTTSAASTSAPSTTSAIAHRDAHALKELEDGELLAEFQSGNEKAFYILFERRQKEIFTHCFRMCSGDAEKANDAFQDTFVKVFLRKDLFTNAANGRAWLYRIATNTCLNQLRYDKRHPKEQLDVTLGAIDPKLQPDFASQQENLRSELERAIAKLPMELREPFLLRELEEFSYEEVSEQLGLTVAACRQRVYRAKQMLREELEEMVTGEPKKKKSGWNPFAGGRSS